MGKMGLLTFIKNLRLKNDQENNYNLFKASCLGTLLKVVFLFKTIKTFPCNFCSLCGCYQVLNASYYSYLKYVKSLKTK